MKLTLKAARVNAGLSQAAVAERLGRTSTTISKWEKNQSDITLRDFKKLCALYSVNESQIFIPEKLSKSLQPKEDCQ